MIYILISSILYTWLAASIFPITLIITLSMLFYIQLWAICTLVYVLICFSLNLWLKSNYLLSDFVKYSLLENLILSGQLF